MLTNLNAQRKKTMAVDLPEKTMAPPIPMVLCGAPILEGIHHLKTNQSDKSCLPKRRRCFHIGRIEIHSFRAMNLPYRATFRISCKSAALAKSVRTSGN